MIAAIVVFVAGIGLAITKPGDLGGKTSTNQASSPTTKPSTTTSSGAGTSSATGTTLTPASTGSSSSGSTPTTPTTVKASGAPTTTAPAPTTTITPGGLGQSGAGGAEGGQHPVTGGTSMLAIGLLVIGAAFAVRRSVIA